MKEPNQHQSTNEMRLKALGYAAIYMVLAGLWILFSGTALEMVVGNSALREQLEIFKGLFFVFFTGIALYVLLRAWQRDMSDWQEKRSLGEERERINKKVQLPLVYLLALLIVIASGGYVFFEYLKQNELNKIKQNIADIAGLKADQINNWLKQNKDFAIAVGQGSHLARSFDAWVKKGSLPEPEKTRLRKRLETFRKNQAYAEIVLYDVHGRPYLRVADEGNDAEMRVAELIAQTVKRKTPVVGAMQWRKKRDGTDYISLPMAAPLMNESAGRHVTGVILFELNPQETILPIIQGPSANRKATETMVFLLDGENLVYLNESRLRKGARLSTQDIMPSPYMLKAKTMKGASGFIEDRDHRNRHALGYAVRIPGTAWTMLTEIDRHEMEKPIQRLAINIALTAILLGVVGSLSLYFWWRQKRAKYDMQHEKAMLQQQMLSKQVDILSKYASDAMILMSFDGDIVEVNDRAESMYGYTQAQFKVMKTDALSAPGEVSDNAGMKAALLEKKMTLIEANHKRADGSIFPVELSAGLIQANEKLLMQWVVRDISERKHSEARVQRLKNLYHALSETNSAIIHLKDQEALYQLACRIAVEQGGMMMAWIGVTDEAGQYIIPVHSFGRANGYLEQLKIPVSPDEIKGKGPTASTYREGQEVVVNDFDTGTNTAPWHPRARQFGVRASATFPIKNHGKTCAVFTVYSELNDAFDDEIVALLREIATNLSFAIENIERDAQRKQTELALRQSEARLQRVAEEAPFPMMVLGEDGEVLQVNKVWTEITGYTQADIPTFDIWAAKAYGYKGGTGEEHFDNLFSLEGRYDTGERVIRCKNGDLRTWHFIAAPLGRLPDDLRYVISMATDVTESRKAEAELRLAATVFESSHSAIVITDSDANIVAINPAFSKITGYTESEVIGQNPRMLHSGRQAREFYQVFWRTLMHEGRWQGEIWNCRKNGEEYAAWLSISALRDDKNQVQYYIGIADDVTESKRIQSQMEYLAYHDSLTGLPNRMLANDRLEQAMVHANRSKNRVAVMFLDLDDFKTINDTLGHSVGDALLKSVAERLQACVRESDTVSRLGGDEFLVMLHDVTEIEAINRIAVSMLEAVNKSYRIGDHELMTSTSIGIAVFPEDGDDRDTLLKNADMAMYNAKQSGRNTHRFFAEEMNDYVLEHLLIRNGLTRALENNEFQLHFQPLLDLSTGKPVGAEALIRWRHPELGMIPPNRFIQVAEDTGMIIPIGNWVMQEACRQAKSWHEAGWPALRVAVNISAVQFRRGDLESVVATALSESGLASTYLELELTESILIQEVEKTLEVLHRLGQLGVHLSIDDFGTGYSSLAYLRRLPVDKLKIDQSFVNEITTRPDDAAIALSIITLAHSLRKRVIAEGVETPEQLRFLQQHACDEIQGYLFSRPLTAEAFTAFLQSGARADFLAQID